MYDDSLKTHDVPTPGVDLSARESYVRGQNCPARPDYDERRPLWLGASRPADGA
jgi:hypothetical protein